MPSKTNEMKRDGQIMKGCPRTTSDGMTQRMHRSARPRCKLRSFPDRENSADSRFGDVI